MIHSKIKESFVCVFTTLAVLASASQYAAAQEQTDEALRERSDNYGLASKVSGPLTAMSTFYTLNEVKDFFKAKKVLKAIKNGTYVAPSGKHELTDAFNRIDLRDAEKAVARGPGKIRTGVIGTALMGGLTYGLSTQSEKASDELKKRFFAPASSAPSRSMALPDSNAGNPQ